MIRVAIRFQDNTVMVFDGRGNRIPRYQGRYEQVRGSILRDAVKGVVFAHSISDSRVIRRVSREEW